MSGGNLCAPIVSYAIRDAADEKELYYIAFDRESESVGLDVRVKDGVRFFSLKKVDREVPGCKTFDAGENCLICVSRGPIKSTDDKPITVISEKWYEQLMVTNNPYISIFSHRLLQKLHTKNGVPNIPKVGFGVTAHQADVLKDIEAYLCPPPAPEEESSDGAVGAKRRRI